MPLMTRIAGIPVAVRITERTNEESTYKYIAVEEMFSGEYYSEPNINGWASRQVIAQDITTIMWDSFRGAVGTNTIPVASPFETIEEMSALIDENYYDTAWRDRERNGEESILDAIKKYGVETWLLSSSANDSPASK